MAFLSFSRQRLCIISYCIGCFKRALQWYSKCYCVTGVMKTFTPQGLQIVQRLTPSVMGSLYAFKYKRFHNTRHTVAFGIQL
jgi:hypothetical protein